LAANDDTQAGSLCHVADAAFTYAAPSIRWVRVASTALCGIVLRLCAYAVTGLRKRPRLWPRKIPHLMAFMNSPGEGHEACAGGGVCPTKGRGGVS
jgi:hypothetical protein